MESNIEKDINMKSQNRKKNLPCPIENTDAACKSYVDSSLNDPSMIRNRTHVGFNNMNFGNV